MSAAHAHGEPLVSRRVELAPTAEAPRLARRATDAIAEAAGGECLGFMLRLVASELVNNAVLHGSPDEPILLEVELFDGRVLVRVRNAGGRLTLSDLRRRKRRTESGRGLDIVDALADAWTIDARPGSTTIAVQVRIDSV